MYKPDPLEQPLFKPAAHYTAAAVPIPVNGSSSNSATTTVNAGRPFTSVPQGQVASHPPVILPPPPALKAPANFAVIPQAPVHALPPATFVPAAYPNVAQASTNPFSLNFAPINVPRNSVALAASPVIPSADAMAPIAIPGVVQSAARSEAPAVITTPVAAASSSSSVPAAAASSSSQLPPPMFPNLAQQFENLIIPISLPTPAPAPAAAKGPKKEEKPGANKQVVDLTAKVFRVLLELGVDLNKSQQEKILSYVPAHLDETPAMILLHLYEQHVIQKAVLLKLIIAKHDFSKDKYLQTWWEGQKNLIRSRYLNLASHQSRRSGSTALLDAFIANVDFEIREIEKLKTELTKYARDYFYIYRSGSCYFYSPHPDEESMGGRCDSQGQPLKDSSGNVLTDDLGNFLYSIKELHETSPNHYTQTQRQVPAGTPGATPYTDEDGTPLSVKYKELIKNEKRKPTSRPEAQALNAIFQLIETASAAEIYRFITNPSFQQSIAAPRLRIGRYLIDICSKFVSAYQAMSNKLTDEVLLDILMDEQLYAKLPHDKLAILFWRYNSKLVADVVVNLYQDTAFQAGDYNFDTMKKVLADDADIINSINVKKCEVKTALILPSDYRVPGKNPLEEEQLTKAQRFQYTEETIAAIEEWLRNRFSNLLVNQKEGAPHALTLSAPYYFYQIPANPYMLIDPSLERDPNYHRYRQLKDDLTRLVNDSKINSWGKPIIFTGIINIDGTHYIPYFIYKNRANKIFVITVDPSPKIYPGQYHDVQHVDYKLETFRKAGRIFQDLLPGCSYVDPMTSQMLRERDCGPNSAQTVADAFIRATTAEPLLYIDSDDSLRLEVSRLTIHGNPIGINPYTKTYVYSGELERATNINRSRWQDLLSQVRVKHYITRPKHLEGAALSVLDSYSEIAVEYDYAAEVNAQVLHDERNINISAIQSILLSDEQGKKLTQEIIDYYKLTLDVMDLSRIAEHIRSKTSPLEIERYTATHQNNLKLLLEDVATVILKDHMVEALASALQEQVLAKLPDRTDLQAEVIVSEFLAKHRAIFSKLTPNEQIAINTRLLIEADAGIRRKLIGLHRKSFQDLLERNCWSYLTSVLSQTPVIFGTNDLAGILLMQLESQQCSSFFTDKEGRYKPEQIDLMLSYLRNFDSDKLVDTFQKVVESTANKALFETMGFARRRLALDKKTLHEVLTYIDRAGRQFHPPRPSDFLPVDNEKTFVLPLRSADTILGAWLLPKTIEMFLKDLHAIFPHKVRAHAAKLVAKTQFADHFKGSKLLDLDQQITPNEMLVNPPNFEDFLAKHGTEDSVTLDDYRHQFAHPILRFELEKALVGIIVSLRNEEFKRIADLIITAVKQYLSLYAINKKFDLNGDLTAQIFGYVMHESPELAKMFTDNFLIEKDGEISGYTTCGDRFYRYFATNYSQVILVNCQKMLDFNANLTAVVNQLTILQATEHPMISKVLEKLLLQLNEAVMHVYNISLDLSYENNFPLLRKNITVVLQDGLIALMSKIGYVKGDITPGSIATLIRPIACRLLDIDVKGARIVTPSQAIIIDEAIIARCKDPDVEFSIHETPLVILKPVDKLPETHDKALTPQLLIELISYWYSHAPTGTSLKNLLQKDRLPPLIHQLINIVNSSVGLEVPISDMDIAVLKQQYFNAESKNERRGQLALYSATDATSQILVAMLRTKELGGDELKKTSLTFSQLYAVLRGKEYKPEEQKTKAKPKLSRAQFTDLVARRLAEKNAGMQAQAAAASSSSPSASPDVPRVVSMQEVAAEIMEEYQVEGAEKKEDVSPAEFEAKVMQTFRERNAEIQRAYAKQIEGLSAEQQAGVKRPAMPNLNDIRKELASKYNKVEPKAADDDSAALIIPAKNLERRGLSSLGFWGNTMLDKELQLLKARSQDDTLDEYAVNQLRLRLKERWQRLTLQEGEKAFTHYLGSENYRDNEYIAIAGIIARYYRSTGKMVYVYELLMPKLEGCAWGYPPSSSLVTTKLPAIILSEFLNYNGNEEAGSEPTLDDLPIGNLVFLRSGYVVDIDWVVRRYTVSRSLNNPYTDLRFTVQDLEDLMRHPGFKRLADQVTAYCVPHVSPRAIDLLEDYVIGTVFANGFGGYYNDAQNEAKDRAAQKFAEELGKISKAEKDGLMNEIIPGNQNNETVGAVIRASTTNCATYQGTQLARVVIAYKPDSKLFQPEYRFIIERIGDQTVRNLKGSKAFGARVNVNAPGYDRNDLESIITERLESNSFSNIPSYHP